MAKFGPLKKKKFIKFLSKVGCFFVRNGGNHDVYWRDGINRPVTVPRHDMVSARVIRSNLSTLGISLDEYLKIMDEL
ncbi:MAG: hypothetical protein A3A97_04625 [Candidatus Terrybacteria bacterium RIFCSPLOWO2_01_FULL_40_23]|uniref:Addiction module toxin, HicA family n=1 Tax=Candidatus Terrybacteria bacterium RIFCSPLOWO2_01_FULL_40_23 TaxID=1802366 RepID=A0A1G2PV08_9BACT|nr:MAG: hypothetical protein A3A97_04625 [Candidatus Terrybacteria bacterium RIFCSPLOWO2_01_FULL_40_23]